MICFYWIQFCKKQFGSFMSDNFFQKNFDCLVFISLLAYYCSCNCLLKFGFQWDGKILNWTAYCTYWHFFQTRPISWLGEHYTLTHINMFKPSSDMQICVAMLNINKISIKISNLHSKKLKSIRYCFLFVMCYMHYASKI